MKKMIIDSIIVVYSRTLTFDFVIDNIDLVL